MAIKQYLMEDKAVGAGNSEFFQPELNMVKRFAMIPAFITNDELNISPEMAKKAESDPTARADVQWLSTLKEMLQFGISKPNPTVETWSQKGDEANPEGFLYAPTIGARVHFKDGTGSFLCKADEGANCCEMMRERFKKEAYLNYGVVVLEYDCNPVDGSPKMLQGLATTPFADGKLDFKYSLKNWNLNENRMKDWKNKHFEFPPISSDYTVTLVKQGNYQNLKIETTKTCLWRSRGKALQRDIIKKASEKWDRVARTLYKHDFSVPEIAQMFSGQATVPTEMNVGSMMSVSE